MTQHKQLNDLRLLNAAGIRLALQKASAIRTRALNAFVSNEDVFQVKDILIDGYKDVLTRAMRVSYLAGWRRVEADAFSRTLKLSEMSDLERTLAKLGHSDAVAELEAQLESRAIRVLQDSTDDIETRLRSKINDLIAEGSTVARGKKELGQVFDKLGLTPTNSYQIENIFRTQTQLVYGAAKDHAEQSPEVQEILWGYRYVTVGDNRVREEHAAMEGVSFEKNDPLLDMWYPPNGWSCRCQVIALFSRPRGRLKSPPSNAGVVDPSFNFRPGQILVPPRNTTASIAVPKATPTAQSRNLTAYESAAKDPTLSQAGIKIKKTGEIQINKPKNISMAREQLAKIQQLRDAAMASASAADSLPKNSPEKVKAQLTLVHLVQQYERVVRNVKSFLD